MVNGCILQHVDRDEWEAQLLIERQEREAVRQVLSAYGQVA
jgi:hypothetical protein